jgi:hypothetical protein
VLEIASSAYLESQFTGDSCLGLSRDVVYFFSIEPVRTTCPGIEITS